MMVGRNVVLEVSKGAANPGQPVLSVKGLEVFDGLLDQLFTSDSFPQQPTDKISVIAFAAK
mgnify:CR=1 FL=1